MILQRYKITFEGTKTIFDPPPPALAASEAAVPA